MTFADRLAAGEALAAAVAALDWADGDDTIVLGIPRGGVVVAAPVAAALGCPLDVAVARKIGAPGNPELAIGAVAPSGPALVNESLIRRLGVTDAYLRGRIGTEREELDRRLAAYRGDRPPLALSGRRVVVVDDGVATGATLIAIAQWLRSEDVARLIVAVPVGAPDAIRALRAIADQVVCLASPRFFSAVGEWYREFGQTADDEVIELMTRARQDEVS